VPQREQGHVRSPQVSFPRTEVNENEVSCDWVKSTSDIGRPLMNLKDRKNDAVIRSSSIPREKENEPDAI